MPVESFSLRLPAPNLRKILRTCGFSARQRNGETLRNLAHGKRMKEVALIFVTVEPAQQPALPFTSAHAANVVTGGDLVGFHLRGKFREGFKFDLFIAQGISGSAYGRFVLFKEQFKTLSQYSAAKLTVCSSMPSLYFGLRVSQIGCCGTVFLPSSSSQFFMNRRFYLITLLLQQRGGN